MRSRSNAELYPPKKRGRKKAGATAKPKEPAKKADFTPVPFLF